MLVQRLQLADTSGRQVCMWDLLAGPFMCLFQAYSVLVHIGGLYVADASDMRRLEIYKSRNEKQET